MDTSKPQLILDTNVFIGDSQDLNQLRLNYNLLITPEVIEELKYGPGKRSMQLIKAFLKKKTPSPESRKLVKKFAKKTGDSRVLSAQDVGVIAAALDLIKKAGKGKFINSKPKRTQNKFGKKKKKTVIDTKEADESKLSDSGIDAETVAVGENKEIDEGIKNEEGTEQETESVEQIENTDTTDTKTAEATTDKQTEIEAEEPTKVKAQSEKVITKESDWDIPEFCDGWVKNAEITNSEKNDYSGGWLGPDNINRMNTKAGEDSTDRLKLIGVGIVTKDFAMQNVILQMGIPLLSLDGTVISKLKSYVLECFSCISIEKETDTMFCKKCGKDTLARVTCEYSDEGKLILFRKKNYRAKQRGVRYNIPDPKGGRRINDLLITQSCFEQRKVVSYLRKQNTYQKKKSKQMEIDWDLGWGFDDCKFKAKKFGELEVGYGRKNPNVNSFWKNKRKRK